MAVILIAIPMAYLFLLPSDAYAWGPLTHVYYGNEVLALGSLLPPAVWRVIRRFRQDFIYGNVMPDAVLAKSYQPRDADHCHSWPMAMGLLESARTDSERSFAMGYLCHLAADTVAHNDYTAGQRNLGHAFLEMKADSLMDSACWFQALSIGREVQKRNDSFLEQSIKTVLFSPRTNRAIFKGVVALSGVHGRGIKSFGLVEPGEREMLDAHHMESIARMCDVLSNGEAASALSACPIGEQPTSRIMGALLS